MTLSPQDLYDEATDAAYDKFEADTTEARRRLQAAIARAQSVFDAAKAIAQTQYSIDTAEDLRRLNDACKAADEAFRAAMAEHVTTLDPVRIECDNAIIWGSPTSIEHDFTDDPD